VGLAPQLVVWRLASGFWIVNSYSVESDFHWLEPQIFGVSRLLSKWLPVLTASVTGSAILAWRRRDPIVGASVLGTLFSLYLLASWWAWEIAGRAAFDHLATTALGLGIIFQASRRISHWGPWLAAAALADWNIPLIAADSFGGPSEWVREWINGVRILL
jgi:hypothetical protein